MTFDNYELVGGADGSYSGGFTRMPLVTFIDKESKDTKEKVSDLFLGLAVPYWAFSPRNADNSEVGCSSCGETDDDRVIDDDLYDKLLDSIQYYVGERKPVKSRKQRNFKKQTKKNR